VHNVLYKEAKTTTGGDDLLVGRPDEEGDSLGRPQELIDLLMNTEQYRCEVLNHGATQRAGNGVWYGDWVGAYNVR